MTSVPVYYNYVLKDSLLVASVLGFACQVVRRFYHICSLFRVRLCWGGGGSVANEGLVLYIGMDYGLHLNVLLFVQYVSRRVVMVSSWGGV